MKSDPMPATANKSPNFPFEELSRIESTIGAMQSLLSGLQVRRDALNEELDRLTQPKLVPVAVAMPHMIGPGYIYNGKFTGRGFYIDIYVDVLRHLWTDFPELREAMAMAIARFGARRRYVAKNRGDLFKGKSLEWVHRNSRPLVDGWFADTNLNFERMTALLPVAVRAAGLKWGVDLTVYWHRAPT